MATHNNRFVMAKIDPLFAKKCRDVALERIKKGVDKSINKEQMSIRRYTNAITRYEPLWKILAEAEFKEGLK